VKLSDVVSAAGLSIYAEIALVLFLGAFLSVVLRLYWPGRDRAGRDRSLDAAARLPLDDGTPTRPAFAPSTARRPARGA
jgi:cbb3-type cytochrome oxidase subunit 3